MSYKINNNWCAHIAKTTESIGAAQLHFVLVGFCGGCVVGSSSGVWQRSSPALGLQPPTPSVAQLWVALAPQFDHKTCYLCGGFVVQVWWGLPQRAQSWATPAPHFCHTSATQCGGSVAGPNQ